MVASPKAWVAWFRSAHVHPPSTPHGAPLGVDPDALHPSQVQDETAVAGSETWDAVTAPAYGEEEILLRGKPHRRDHVGHPDGTDDERGAPVVHGVVDFAGFVVVLVTGAGSTRLVERFSDSQCPVPSTLQYR